MKYRQNGLRKVFSLVVALGMFASTSGVGLFAPRVAEATNDQEQDKGEIWVCKTLLDSEGSLIAGSDNDQQYTIGFYDNSTDLTTEFNGALTYNTDLFSDIPGNDAFCEIFTDIDAGEYFYQEEVIKNNVGLYETPLYHDGYEWQATHTSHLLPFDEDDDLVDGHIVLYEGDERVLMVLNQLKEVQSEVPSHANLYATKVVCEDEADLPNWGPGAPLITADTAHNWVNDSNGKCEIVDWDFQWAPSSTLNPGDNLGNQASWNTFTGSTTIPEDEFGNDSFVWVREVFHPDYVPFTGVGTVENVSAEVYCAEDGLHYDNYDRVDDLEIGQDYYCVGFNALKDVPADQRIGRCELENGERWAYSVGSFEQGDRKDGGPVLVERSDPSEALGVEDDADVGIDFVSLGFGGEIILEFSQPFVDAPGDDIKIYETSYDNPSFVSYPEQARVYVSSDGDDFTFLGIAELDTTFDLTDINYTDPVKFIKLVDVSEISSFGNDADGFDLAGIEVLVCVTNGEEDHDVFSITGNKTEVTPSGSSNGEGWTIYLLDLDKPTHVFEVDSTSEGGTDSPILTNGEMYLVQASGTYKFGNPNPGNADNRRADAEYSSELGDWTDAANAHGDKLDLVIDGVHLDWGVYTPTHTYYTFIEGDGSSVNFVIDDEPRDDNEESLTVKIYELDGLESEVTDSNGNYSFGNLLQGNYFIYEENQTGWEQIGPDSRSTDHCMVSFVDGSETQSVTCDFVNRGQDEDPGEITRTRSSRSGQILGARLSTLDDSDDDDTEGEVMGASTSYPGLPNAGAASAVGLAQAVSFLGVGLALYSLAGRKTLIPRNKKVR